MAHQSHQWHVPPPPQYGGTPYQYQPQLQTPGQQPFSYNPSAPSPSIRPQYAYPPPINQARFDANSQIPSPNAIPPHYSSPGFNSALFHHFANSSLPPPPLPSFPPLQLPNGNFPPFIPPPLGMNNNFQNQYVPQGQGTPSNTQQHYRGVGQSTYNTDHYSLPQAEKQQEMEISEGDLENSQAKGKAMPADAIGLYNDNTSADTLEGQKIDVAASASFDRTDSVSSYNPPSATPPESSNAVAPHASKVDESSKYHGRGAFEMRNLAKGALLSLAPHNIKFSDLVAEGIDALLLSQLFEEVGLKTVPNVTSKPATTNALLAAESEAAQPVLNKPSPTTNLATGVVHQINHSNPTEVAASTAPVTGTPVRQQKDAPTRIIPATMKASDPTQSSAGPAMERKDVIAAMLAAKMGKLVSRKESPSATTLALPANVTQGSSTAAEDVSEPRPHLDPQDASSQASLDGSSSRLTPPPRSKAQTELVRHKMEQLKQESATKAQTEEVSQKPASLSVNRSASSTLNGLKNYAQAGLPPKPVSTMGNTQMPSVNSNGTSCTVTGFAPTVATFASSIPGLFMTDVEPDPGLVPLLEQDLSARPVASLATMTETLASSEALRGARQRPTSLDLNTLSRETSISRPPSKRSLAVDAFDEQGMPPAKQRDSRPESSHGPDLILADEFSDDVSEGEIMEIDEGSPVSPLPKTPGSRSFPIMSNASKRPAVDFSAPRNPYQQNYSFGVGSTEASSHPDVHARGPVAPSKHSLELEAMKKKLAEAEDRRNAKQQAQLQSSASSPLNPPVMPASSSPVAFSNTNAMPMADMRQQHSQLATSVAQGSTKPVLNGSEPRSAVPSAPIDFFQREKELREKLLRQRMLKQGLPELDKEVQKTQDRQVQAQARLTQLRREAEKREHEAREARKREKEIMEEVKKLEQQLAMGINGQQQFSQEIETLDQEISPQVVPTSAQASESQPFHNQQPRVATVAAKVERDRLYNVPPKVNITKQLPIEQDTTLDSADSMTDSDDDRSHPDYNSRHVRPSVEAALPTAEEEAASLHPAAGEESVSGEKGIASYEDNEHYEADNFLGEGSPSDDSPMEVHYDSDGSASMSDSGSEDYQPAEPIISTEMADLIDDEDEEYDPANAPISGAQSPPSDEDQEDYEPSEAVEPLETQTLYATGAQDQTALPLSNGTTSENEAEQGDDREPGLELTEANTLTSKQKLLLPITEAADTNHSALSNFKSYRFNPRFKDYRSLTYSNAIDPSKPLCPTEAEGGMCNDLNCEEQHFRQMSLADEKILVQMSSASDIQDKAQRDSFVAGLKLVIADLRTKQISDFDTVASELAAYRRRFRQEQHPSLAFTADEL